MFRNGKFNISLDIDATLACTDDVPLDNTSTFESLELYTNPERASIRSRFYVLDMVDVMGQIGKGKRMRMWGVTRPYLHEFLQFCESYFNHTIIWSAGKPKYVEAMTDILFPEIKFQPSMVFNSLDCDIGKSHVYKPLFDIFNREELNGEVNETNIFHVDDRSDTFSKNVDNGIIIPPYSPQLQGSPDDIIASINKKDDTLLQLMCWLSLPEVINCDDIRKLDKTNIFTTSVSEYIERLE
jgi:hypothetical protein